VGFRFVAGLLLALRMFKPSFKISSFAPPKQPPAEASATLSETLVQTASDNVGSSIEAFVPSSVPLNVELNALVPPSAAKDDDEIAEEVEYDEVRPFLLCISWYIVI
jgi:hypothetical protein